MRCDMTTKKTQDRFQVFHASDALKDQEPIEWLIENLMTTSSINIIAGAAGSKKTYAMLDLAVCVALGKNWLDYKTSKGAVLIVDEENGAKRLTRRLAQVQRGHLLDQPDPGTGKKHPDIPLYFTTLSALDLGNIEDITQLQLLIEKLEIKLVIIDSLVDVMPGKDENSARDTQMIFRELRRLSDVQGVVFVVIHHLNKMGSTRGSTAIPGGVDLVLQVESRGDTKTIKFQTEKARDIDALTFYATANFSGDRKEPVQFYLTGRDEPDEAIHFGNVARQIFVYLLKNGKSSRDDISNGVEAAVGSVRNEIGKLSLKDKYIKRTDGGGKGTKATYELTKSGRSYASKL